MVGARGVLFVGYWQLAEVDVGQLDGASWRN
jgi:hypothetical protein